MLHSTIHWNFPEDIINLGIQKCIMLNFLPISASNQETQSVRIKLESKQALRCQKNSVVFL